MHDGAFTTLDAAIRHHLNPTASLLSYQPDRQGLPIDLVGPIGPRARLVAALDPRLRTGTVLSTAELDDLEAFVRDALLDPRARPEHPRRLVPATVPSGNGPLIFEVDNV